MSLKVEERRAATEADFKKFLKLKEESKAISEQIAEIGEIIRTSAEQRGKEQDNGNILLVVGSYEAKLEARTSVSLNADKAESVLKKAKVYSDCIEVTISDDKVEQAFKSGKLTAHDMSMMVEKRITHALKVRKV